MLQTAEYRPTTLNTNKPMKLLTNPTPRLGIALTLVGAAALMNGNAATVADLDTLAEYNQTFYQQPDPVTGLPAFPGGGMMSSGSGAWMRSMIADCLGWPGTMATRPDSSFR